MIFCKLAVFSPLYRQKVRRENNFSSGFCRGFSLPSRGTTIITQKENKGEYGGMHCASDSCLHSTAWKWDDSNHSQDIYAHIFDQNGPNGTNGTPSRYSNDSSDWNKSWGEYWLYPDMIPQCSDYDNPTVLLDRAKGLYGNNYQKTIKNQYSCKPNTHNAGNWYNFPAATAGSNNASVSSNTEVSNSICPKGWRLPPNSGNKSYNTLIRTAYGLTAIDSYDVLLTDSARSAMSFIELGFYGYAFGTLNNRGNLGNYWSSTVYGSINSYLLNSAPETLSPQNNANRADGMSIHCVSR